MTIMKTEMKSSSTGSHQKANKTSRTVLETKIKTDQKVLPSSNRSTGNGTQLTTENHPKTDVKSSSTVSGLTFY